MRFGPWQRIAIAHSPISGPISIWELSRERQLIFSEYLRPDPESVVFTKGSWAELRRECWGRAVEPPFELVPRPRVLILGLGGGTMVHLADQALHPKSITAVELDPMVVEMAQACMGLGDIPNLEIRVADVHAALAELKTAGETFDLIIEDIFHLGLPSSSDDQFRAYIASLVDVLSPNGRMAFNRWPGREARLVHFLGEWFGDVRCERIMQRWRTHVIFASELKSR